ncbi:CHY zinc finger protein, partial [Staphylococcus agnetis]|uniref:CHY zinc finger protein n=1 Tax=Staphylococcus agnetis TaxID=985762 RepID=UPI000D038E17
MPTVYGQVIDDETRCVHYSTILDVIAIKFKCCNKYYPCYKCHNEAESHRPKRWKEHEFNEKAILCGVCKHEMTINEYMLIEACPRCNAHFNSRCKLHYHLYFENIKSILWLR